MVDDPYDQPGNAVTSTGDFEHRIGRRHRVDPIPIGWRVNPKPSLLSRRTPPKRAEVVDVSLSGAAIRASFAEDLELDQLLFIEVDGTIGQVFLRRIEREGDTAVAVYGVEFAHPNGRMAQRLTSKVIVAPVVAAVDGWSEGLGNL
ncbi:MAG: PilZ domain-containing protein [Acidimicrobiales bacterium]|nr:PilZ domain-containing protein [Acidimicrobiales bacterium]